MESALILSHSEKSATIFIDLLRTIQCHKIVVVSTCGEARRKLLERDFEICIINSPLSDESGEKFAKDIATKYALQILLVVKMEQYDTVSEKLEDIGVMTIGKPINRNAFLMNLKFLRASSKRITHIQKENSRLMQKIQDIKLIDRAKCILVSNEYMSEEMAHKHIEKTAMDSRQSKRIIAEHILSQYNA
ncbi:MAG: ANTAR domain-containing protein [Bacillota bacterium]